MKVCLGGTFDNLHKGHKTLIDKAFELAGSKGRVFIGLTTADLIKEKGKIKSYSHRKKNIEKYLSTQGFIKQATIKPIKDKYGPSIDDDFDIIVVSPETLKTAREINKKRKEKGKKPLKIVKISFVLAEDKIPISSSRIRKKEIDENGNIIHKD